MRAKAKFAGMPEMLKKMADLREFSTLEKISYKGTFGSGKELRAEIQQAIADDPHIVEETGALFRGPAMKKIAEGTQRGYTVGFRHGAVRKKHGKDDPFYWWFVEFGTSRSAPRGFFRRAIASFQGRALPMIQNAALKAVFDAAARVVRQHGNGKR